MIFIIDIDCCVFFWFQGAFFFCWDGIVPLRLGLRGSGGLWPAGSVFFWLVEVDQVELFTEFTG